MSSAPSVNAGRVAPAIASRENEGGVLDALRRESPPRHIVRSGKRAEDTAVGCRANAAADLGRAGAPGGDFMRVRLEHSAAVWSARADLLDRLEKKSVKRANGA